jgi:chemotaxis protein methyltransferase WspC
MPLQVIEQLLKRHMGLHSATIGSATVHQAVEQRMRDCDIPRAGDYLKVLEHSATELDALIDTVVIPETWFFRDIYPFHAFSSWVRDEWLTRASQDPLRVLSVPCSTGEEPYTLAMCLCDIGLTRSAAQIEAVDISHRNIDKARSAIYGSNSFRGNDLDFRDRHFTAENQRYRLKDEIRQCVSFERANIVDPGFQQQRQPYHVIFCRNLLIYFDRPTQNAAIESLEQLLTADGILFLGHSETSLLTEREFAPLDYPRCFAFRRGRNTRKADDAQAATPPPRADGKPHRPHRKRPLRKTADNPFSNVPVTTSDSEPAAQSHDSEQLLQEAFRLADQGHLDEAAQHCMTLLRRQELQADAHYLLGLIRESTGNYQDAEQHLRKAIYLKPDHYEALTHLGVICLQTGDRASAQRFQQRAERTRKRNGKVETSV